MAKTSCKKGQYYCNTDKKCKPIPRGFTVREDGFLVGKVGLQSIKSQLIVITQKVLVRKHIVLVKRRE